MDKCLSWQTNKSFKPNYGHSKFGIEKSAFLYLFLVDLFGPAEAGKFLCTYTSDKF